MHKASYQYIKRIQPWFVYIQCDLRICIDMLWCAGPTMLPPARIFHLECGVVHKISPLVVIKCFECAPHPLYRPGVYVSGRSDELAPSCSLTVLVK